MTQHKGKSEMQLFQRNISITQDGLIFNNNNDRKKKKTVFLQRKD